MKSPLKFQWNTAVSDVGGACMSMLCMVHCVIAPLLLTPFLLESVIPETALEADKQEGVHFTMFIFTLTFGIRSVYFSARRGKHMAVLCLSLGLVAVTTAELFMHDLVTVRVPGTLCIVGGHLWAMRSRGSVNEAHTKSCQHST